MVDSKTDLLLKRGVVEIIVEEEFKKLLKSGRELRLKQGFDPSRPDIHLGHVVSLRKLRQFQELGHHVILIVGDWTAQIGDPSGESQTRPMLSRDEVLANAETYLRQFFKVVDKKRAEVRWQSEWFGNFTLGDVIALTSKFTLAQFLAREDFAKRHQAGKPIALTELLYPLLQAYDSVVVKADVELGGVDQKFNCLVGRDLQQMMGQQPQQVFLTPLLVGTDGRQKMSKSLGNYIAIEDPANEMYGKTMSITDELILDYFELLTEVPDDELAGFRQALAQDKVNPMELKKRLARELVSQFHNQKAAEEAEEYFTRVYQREEMPEEIPERAVPFIELENRMPAPPNVIPPSDSVMAGTVDVLCRTGLVESRSEAKRLLLQGAVEFDGKRITGETASIRDGSVIRVGKRRFVKIVDADKKSA